MSRLEDAKQKRQKDAESVSEQAGPASPYFSDPERVRRRSEAHSALRGHR